MRLPLYIYGHDAFCNFKHYLCFAILSSISYSYILILLQVESIYMFSNSIILPSLFSESFLAHSIKILMYRVISYNGDFLTHCPMKPFVVN